MKMYVVKKDQPCWDTGGLFLKAGEKVEIVYLSGESATVEREDGKIVTVWKRDIEVRND